MHGITVTAGFAIFYARRQWAVEKFIVEYRFDAGFSGDEPKINVFV